MFSQCHFIIPDTSGLISGGNAYNAHLIMGLKLLGIHVSEAPFRPEMTPGSPDTLYVLDSIYFPQITRPAEQIPPGCIGLVHHLESLFPLSEAHFQAFELPVLKHFTGFLVTSDFTRTYLSDNGCDPLSITVIEPAPLIGHHQERTPHQKVRALMLGSCIPRKGQLALLKELAAQSIPPYYQLTIAGSLEADPEYSKHCAEAVLSHAGLKTCVRLLGSQQPEAVDALYRKSNLFISAAAMETFGMAIQDAVVSGLPVLVREGGYAAEHVTDEINGRRCPDIPALAAAFSKCVEDSGYFLDLQKKAIAFRHQYQSWDNAAGRFIQAFLA